MGGLISPLAASHRSIGGVDLYSMYVCMYGYIGLAPMEIGCINVSVRRPGERRVCVCGGGGKGVCVSRAH